jgi:hypothetical protein
MLSGINRLHINLQLIAQERRRKEGVGLLINKKCKRCIEECKYISEGILATKIEIGIRKLT